MGNALVSDVFFVHEQGTRIALWQLSWVVSVNITPLISARIISASGWRTAFLAILGYICFCTVIFFLAAPESTYIRRSESGVDHHPSTSTQRDASAPDFDIKGEEMVTQILPCEAVTPRARSKFAVWNGVLASNNVTITLFRPFVVALTPVSLAISDCRCGLQADFISQFSGV
jgi:MFS family permease